MKAFPLVWVLISCLGLICNHPVAAQAPNPDAALTWWHDGRIVRDAAALRLDQITDDQSWVLAKVKPAPDSPLGREVGSHFDRAGNLVQEPGVRQFTLIIEHGSLSSTTILTGKPQISLEYRLEYEERIGLRIRGETYPIFRAGPGGTAVFRINEQAEGAARFSPAYLIADEWAPFVAPALKYVQANGPLFAVKDAEDNWEKLEQLLGDENPFIAIAAFRVLGEAQQIDTESVQKFVAQAAGLRQSVFVYLALKQSPRAKRLALKSETPPTDEEFMEAVRKSLKGESIADEVSKLIGAAKDAETLKSLVMGIVAVIDNSPQNGIFTTERVKMLMRQVAERQAALNTRTEADLYLDQTLKVMGLKTDTRNSAPNP